MSDLDMKAIDDTILSARSDTYMAEDMLLRGDTTKFDSLLKMAICKLLQVRLAVLVAYPDSEDRNPATE